MSELDTEQEGLPEEKLPGTKPAAAAPEEDVFPLHPDPRWEAPIEAPPPEPWDGTPPVKDPPRGGKRGLRIAAIAVAAVLVLAIAAVFAVPAILQAMNPKAHIAACFARTMGEFGDDDAAAVLKRIGDGPFRMDFAGQMGLRASDPLNYNDKYSLDAPEDQFGCSFAIECDRDARRADMELAFDSSGSPLATLLFSLNDALFSFGSPELTDGDYYYINTETLGADLAASPIFSKGDVLDPSYGFNLFDADPAGARSALKSATVKQLALLTQAFNQMVTVEKSGAPTVQSLGREVSCTQYTMVIPAGALRDYLGQCLQALTEDEDFMSNVSFTDMTPQEFIDAVDQVLATVKNAVTIDFYTADGRMVLLEAAVPMEHRGNSAGIRFIMEFGENGGALACSLFLDEDGSPVLSIPFSYSHVDGDLSISLSIETPNDALTFRADGALVSDRAAGTLVLKFPDVSLTAGSETLALSLRFAVQPLIGFSHEAPAAPTSLLELDENAYYNLLLTTLYRISTIGGDTQ